MVRRNADGTLFVGEVIEEPIMPLPVEPEETAEAVEKSEEVEVKAEVKPRTAPTRKLTRKR